MHRLSQLPDWNTFVWNRGACTTSFRKLGSRKEA